MVRRDDYIIKILAKNILKYRKAKKLTQTELASLIGKSMYSQISRMERGTVNSSISLIHCVAKVLDITAADLLNEDEYEILPVSSKE